MEVVILSAVRTPIGKFLGGLSSFSAPKLGSLAVAEAIRRANLPAATIDEVIMGQVVQAGCGQNPARQTALGAGLPTTINAHTTNMVCGSGLKAAMLGSQSIRAGDAHAVVAGGMESMSNAPFLLPGVRNGYKYGDQTTQDALVRDGLWCAFENWPMGNAAEHIAKSCGISRGDQDRFSAQSHQRAAAAWAAGAFDAEVLPITVPGKQPVTVGRDEGIRADSSVEGLGKLKPAFDPAGTVTAGNASQLSDGAAAVVLANGDFAKSHGYTPLARIRSIATSGVDPKSIFIAPVTAVRMACEKAKVSVGDVDLFELNEAFASQMLACNVDLKIDEARINVNGGAIAMGHPIGASGARVLVTLVHALRARKKSLGLASLCLGGGNAVAMVIEAIGGP
jgi:acetyl-CoA C-acetyltransferase